MGKFLEWGTLNSQGMAKGGCKSDSRVLELNGMEIGHFSISCRFKNVRDGFCWEA